MNRFCFIAASIFLVIFPTHVLAEGGVLYVFPERAEHSIGDVFDVQVLVDSGGVAINAAEAEISFNPSAVSVEKLSIDDSLLDVWPSPPIFSNTDGYIRFSGLMKKTFTGDHGKLATITFRALRNMSSNARFAAGAILAADGQSSNIITSMKSGVFAIQPKEIPGIVDVNSLDERAPVKPAVPVFTEYVSTIKVGDRIVAKGRAESGRKIAVYYSHGNEPATRSDLVSAADGSFTFVASSVADQGVYSIYATAVSSEGISSDQSQKINISAISTGFAASAVVGVSIAYQLMPFAALLVLAGLGGGYLIHRHRIAKLRHVNGG